jgi:hypothetical protein
MKKGDTYVSLKDQGIYLQDIKAALSSPMRVTEASGYMRQSGSFFPSSTSIASAEGGTAHKGLFEERHANHHESENGRQARELQSTYGGAVGSSAYSVSYSRGSQSLAKEKDDTSDHPNWREMAWPALLANPRVPYTVVRRTMTPKQNFNSFLESPRSSTTISGVCPHYAFVETSHVMASHHILCDTTLVNRELVPSESGQAIFLHYVFTVFILPILDVFILFFFMHLGSNVYCTCLDE